MILQLETLRWRIVSIAAVVGTRPEPTGNRA